MALLNNSSPIPWLTKGFIFNAVFSASDEEFENAVIARINKLNFSIEENFHRIFFTDGDPMETPIIYAIKLPMRYYDPFNINSDKIYKRSAEIILALYTHAGIPVNHSTSYSDSLLALEYDNPEAVDVLLSCTNAARLNISNSQLNTICFSSHDASRMLNALFKHGAINISPNCNDDGNTALIHAVSNNDPECVRFLIEKLGADPDYPNKFGTLPRAFLERNYAIMASDTVSIDKCNEIRHLLDRKNRDLAVMMAYQQRLGHASDLNKLPYEVIRQLLLR